MMSRGRQAALVVLVASAVAGCSGDADGSAVPTSAPETVPETATAAPWWEETRCGSGGDLHGEEMAGRPVDDVVVFASLEEALAAELGGWPWTDYREAVERHFADAEPETSEEWEWGEERHETTFVTYPPGPGGATLTAVTWGEDRWAISVFGHAIPCNG